jgi:Nuclease-related domain
VDTVATGSTAGGRDGDHGRGEQGHVGRLRRVSLAAISANPRLPIWERRIAIALVAGIAVTFIFDWRIGITVAVLAAIADTIQRSRTSAAMPPARRGAAQRKTERKLQKLARVGYRTLNERAIPGSENIIDHLVVGPTGVYAIDSERWDKRMPVRVPGSKQQLFHGPFSQKERVAEARWEAARAAELIGGALSEQIDVRPAIAIYGPKIPWHVLTVRNVDVFDANELRKYLRRSIKAGRGRQLTDAQARRIYDAATHVLPERF